MGCLHPNARALSLATLPETVCRVMAAIKRIFAIKRVVQVCLLLILLLISWNSGYFYHLCYIVYRLWKQRCVEFVGEIKFDWIFNIHFQIFMLFKWNHFCFILSFYFFRNWGNRSVQMVESGWISAICANVWRWVSKYPHSYPLQQRKGSNWIRWRANWNEFSLSIDFESNTMTYI